MKIKSYFTLFFFFFNDNTLLICLKNLKILRKKCIIRNENLRENKWKLISGQKKTFYKMILRQKTLHWLVMVFLTAND